MPSLPLSLRGLSVTWSSQKQTGAKSSLPQPLRPFPHGRTPRICTQLGVRGAGPHIVLSPKENSTSQLLRLQGTYDPAPDPDRGQGPARSPPSPALQSSDGSQEVRPLLLPRGRRGARVRPGRHSRRGWALARRHRPSRHSRASQPQPRTLPARPGARPAAPPAGLCCPGHARHSDARVSASSAPDTGAGAPNALPTARGHRCLSPCFTISGYLNPKM